MNFNKKRLKELKEEYNTNEVSTGYILDCPFVEMMQQLQKMYEDDTEFLEIKIKKEPNSNQYKASFVFDEWLSRF